MPFENPHPPFRDRVIEIALRCGQMFLRRFPLHVRQKLEAKLVELAIVTDSRCIASCPDMPSVGLIYKVMINLIRDQLRWYNRHEPEDVGFPENFEIPDHRGELDATGLPPSLLIMQYRHCLRELRKQTLAQLTAEKQKPKLSTRSCEQLQNRLDLMDWLEPQFDSVDQQPEKHQKDIVLTAPRSPATISTELKTIKLQLRTCVLMNTENAAVVACLPLPPDSSDHYSDAYESWQCYNGKNMDVRLDEGGLLTVVRVAESSIDLADSSSQHFNAGRGTVLVAWRHDRISPGLPNLANVNWEDLTPHGKDHRSFSSSKTRWGLPIVLQPHAQRPAVRARLSLHYSGRRTATVSQSDGHQLAETETVPELTVRCSVICQ